MPNAKGLQRLLAYAVDSFIFAAYGAAVFGFVTFGLAAAPIANPWVGQAVAFATLTLPVGLYFAIAEASSWQGTVGKRLLRLRVTDTDGKRISLGRSVLRTLTKLLPWEVAHLGVHHLVAAGNQQAAGDVPWWIWGALLVPLGVALLYVATLFGRSRRTPYDRAAGTRVVRAA